MQIFMVAVKNYSRRVLIEAFSSAYLHIQFVYSFFYIDFLIFLLNTTSLCEK